MAEHLKTMEIPFLDLAGNAYLNEPPVYIYTKGNKPVEQPHRKLATRAFQPTGLKVLFALPCSVILVSKMHPIEISPKSQASLWEQWDG